MEKPKAIDYIPESMSFFEGFLGPKGDVGFFMVADWEKAKKIINQLLAQGRNIQSVRMGLDGDWLENSTVVWSDGIFYEYDCYDLSQWAEPIIVVTYTDRPSETYSCWKKESK